LGESFDADKLTFAVSQLLQGLLVSEGELKSQLQLRSLLRASIPSFPRIPCLRGPSIPIPSKSEKKTAIPNALPPLFCLIQFHIAELPNVDPPRPRLNAITIDQNPPFRT
jgi:hypothetical protein